MRALTAALILVAILVQPTTGLRAGDPDPDHDQDHERARRALEAGEILPLDQILEEVERRHAGTVVELELNHQDGRWVYEVELIAPDGRLLKLLMDAKSKRLLSEEGD